MSYLPSAYAATSTTSCSVSGSFTIVDNVVTGNTDCKGTVTIPTGVTSIAESAFSQSLKDLTTGQEYITSVTISNTVTSIGSYAFSHNKKLTTLIIGNSVTSIGAHAFYDNYALTSVVIPNSVVTIGDSAFEWAKVLKSFTIGTGVTSLGANALRMTNIDILVIPDNVITIGSGFMSGEGANSSGTNRSAKGLRSLTIGDGVTTIGSGAFQDANSLTHLYLGRNITSLGSSSISYAGSLTSFRHCGSLSSAALTSAGLDATKKACPSPPSCEAGNFSSCGLEFNGSGIQMSPGLTPGSNGTFTLQMWVAYNSTTAPSGESFLLGSSENYGFRMWLVGTQEWVIDANGNENSKYTCPVPIVVKTWTGIVVQQSTTGLPVLWMNGSKCTQTSTYNVSNTRMNLGRNGTTITYGQYLGGLPGNAANKWSISNIRFDLDERYILTSSTITPDSYPLSARSSTTLLLGSNNPTATTDSSGVQTFSIPSTWSWSSSKISSAPVFKTTPSLSLSLPSSATTATFGTPVVITATVGTAGSVAFNSAGSSITGCSSVSTTLTSPYTASCTWTPSAISSTNVLTADFTPTDSTGFSSLTGAGSNSINVGKATQTLTFTQPSNMTYGDADQALTFSVDTGLSVAIASTTASVCTIVSNSIHIVTAGTCTVTANQSGNTNYNAATQVSRSITIARATSTISVTGTTSNAYTGSAQGPSTNTKSGSVGTVTYSYQGSGSTVYSATATKPTNVGSYTVIATLAEDSYYASAISSAYAFDINQISESSSLSITTTTATYGTNLTLSTSGATGGSGAITYSVDSGSCTILGTALTPTAAGTCYVTATKATDGNYQGVTSTSTAITVNPKGLTISGLTGVNKEFDGGLVATATGTLSLVGVVNSDNVLLSGTPTFAFASANVYNGITVSASGYTLTGTTAGNYTLTQPSVTANITAKAARVAATNTTVAFGAAVTSGFTTSGLISPDVVGSASYTYTGTGTATPPTAVGVYTVTPSIAVFSTGLIGNYSITYDTATVTILAKYTITYNANGGSVSNGSTATIDFVVGDTALTLPTATRPNYTFTGWYTLQTNGVQVTGAYTPSATATLWARWIQNSLYGMGSNTKILTITTLSGVGNTYSANAGGGTIAIEYLADALPAGTVIDAYVLSDTSTATSLIGAGNDYVMSLVLAWVATDETVPTTATGKPITMTITNSSIKRGAKIYSVIGVTPTLLTTATTDGSAVISITDDPQIIIAITKPDAPTGVSATSGGNASSTVSWTAPSDGGSVITGYTATSNAGQTCTSATTSCSITGLTNGTPYTFTVTATNTIGISDASVASAAATPAAPIVVVPPVVIPPVVTPPSSGGGGGGSTYVEPTPTVDPAVAAAAAAKALADAKAAEEKAAADAKALAEKRAAEEVALLAQIKALQEKADAESLAAAKKLQEELAATQLKAEEELKAAAALKVAEEQRAAAAKKITTVYSTTAAFKLNTTYSKRLTTYSKKIAAGSTVTCIGYAKSSKALSYAKAKTVATKQAKALCTSMKKINPTLVTKSTVLPASKAPVTTVNKKWIPVSYRVQAPVN